MACLAAVLPGAGAAESVDLTRYEVEVIVFRHVDQTGNTPETPDPATAAGARLATSGPRASFLLLDPHPISPEFIGLSRDRLQLNGVYSRLERLGAYQPLLHLGWEQQALPKTRAQPFLLSDATASTSGLTGTIKLYEQRYLHLAVDIRSFDLPAGTAAEPLGDARILESRRLRDDKLQYFDHPRIGVIASVRRVPEPARDDLVQSRQ
jgi:hypothetical protein